MIPERDATVGSTFLSVGGSEQAAIRRNKLSPSDLFRFRSVYERHDDVSRIEAYCDLRSRSLWRKKHGAKMSASRDAIPYKEPSGSLGASGSSISTPVRKEGTGRKTRLDERYELNSSVRDERKNICLIVNVEAFDKRSCRSGAAEDTKKVCALFAELGFTCMLAKAPSKEEEDGVVNYTETGQEATDRPGNRLTSSDIDKAIKDVKERIDPESDIFAFWIMSHGKKGHIVGSDEKEVSLDSILREFSAANCEKLKGKPKLFFVQACQNTGREADMCWNYDIKLPAHFFVGFAAPPGYVSYRDPTEGSPYITAIDKVFRSCLETTCSSVDLTKVMTQVGKEVALNFRAEEDGEESVQMPCYVSSLVGKVSLSKSTVSYLAVQW
ncbi:caspase-7-like [Ornithodoros turicata]|uniref:caspase-7-like n=1 Tax=Ornithodoros turicata TaxID=34597 RepID=UPI003139D632